MSDTTNSPPGRTINQDPAELRRWRKAAGLSLTAAAVRVGKSLSHMSQVESGVKGASPGLLALLAEAYGCNVVDLLDDPPQRRDIAV